MVAATHFLKIIMFINLCNEASAARTERLYKSRKANGHKWDFSLCVDKPAAAGCMDHLPGKKQRVLGWDLPFPNYGFWSHCTWVYLSHWGHVLLGAEQVNYGRIKAHLGLGGVFKGLFKENRRGGLWFGVWEEGGGGASRLCVEWSGWLMGVWGIERWDGLWGWCLVGLGGVLIDWGCGLEGMDWVSWRSRVGYALRNVGIVSIWLVGRVVWQGWISVYACKWDRKCWISGWI